jgi:hypothetical protein
MKKAQMFRGVVRLGVMTIFMATLSPAPAQVSGQKPPAVPHLPPPMPPGRDPHSPGFVTAIELPDGTLPSAAADGNFIIGPLHNRAPEMTVDTNVPQGTVYDFTLSSAESRRESAVAFQC